VLLDLGLAGEQRSMLLLPVAPKLGESEVGAAGHKNLNFKHF
jgi:hypothetical protein